MSGLGPNFEVFWYICRHLLIQELLGKSGKLQEKFAVHRKDNFIPIYDRTCNYVVVKSSGTTLR